MKTTVKKNKQEKEQSEIADQRQDFFFVVYFVSFVYWCVTQLIRDKIRTATL